MSVKLSNSHDSNIMGPLDGAEQLSSFDTRKFEYGPKKTSLSILTHKKNHKTQTQKQLHEFSKQQSYRYNNQVQNQQQKPPHSQLSSSSMSSRKSSFLNMQYQQQNMHSGHGLDLAPPNSSFRKQSNPYMVNHPNHSIDGFLPHQMTVGNGMLPQGQWSTSSPELSLSPASGSYNDTSPPSSTEMDPWVEDKLKFLDDRVKALERENSSLKLEQGLNDKLQESEIMNSTLMSENQELRIELRKWKDLQLNQPIIKEDTESYQEEIDALTRANESLELEIEQMQQQFNKLKLISKTEQDRRNKEITRLKEENVELERELASLHNNDTMETSPNETIESDERSVLDAKAIQEPVDFKSLEAPMNPSVDSMINAKGYNEELIQDLIITIKQLRSDNEVLNINNLTLVNSITKEKKMVRRLAETNKSAKVKIRKGFRVIEGVDLLL